MISEQTNTLWTDLREDNAPMTFVTYLVGGLALVVFDTNSAEPRSWTSIGIMVLIVALIAVLTRLGRRLDLAFSVHMLATLLILQAARWFPNSSVHYALLLPILAVSMLRPFWAPLSLAALVSLAMGLQAFAGGPSLSHGPDHLAMFMFIMWGTVFMCWLAARPMGTMMAWSWQGYEQARILLSEARDRQLELNQALEDLALANTQTTRLNALLTAARQAVDDARKAKEEFVANVSHELRTPLNMIIGFSDMILESPEVYARRLPAALLADVSAIKRNSQHLSDLVDDVLDLAEADAGYTQLVKEWSSIPEVINGAVEAISALFDSKGLILEAKIDEDMPDVYCDRTRIRQVILNLLSNAGRFTESGGAEIRAFVQGDHTITVSVNDTGPGIQPDKLHRMFEPFSQADASIRRRHGGSGLGLAISKRFVEMHGGSIAIESKVDEGTTVIFSLPVREAPLESAPTRWFGLYQEYMPRTRRSRAPQVEIKPSVVVLEDGDTLSNVIRRYIGNLTPICASSWPQALAMVEDQSAVGLLVNRAPGARRLERTQRAQLMRFDVPILSCWIPERPAPSSQVGAQEYLTKPISRSDMLAAMHRIAPCAQSILLVDDDPEARQLFGRMLVAAESTYQVAHATDGVSALAMMHELEPDLVLLDLMMPNMDGYAVLEQKSNDPVLADIPVIIISARDAQREPIASRNLVLSRQGGLTVRDLVVSIQALTDALQPRFGLPGLPEKPNAS